MLKELNIHDAHVDVLAIYQWLTWDGLTLRLEILASQLEVVVAGARVSAVVSRP